MFSATNPLLTVSLLIFDQTVPNLDELLIAEGNVPRSKMIRLAMHEPTEALQEDALLCHDYQMLEALNRTSTNSGVCTIIYDPRVDPFLTGHLHEGIPLLPAVMGIETSSEAASAVSGGEPVVGIRNMELANGFRMALPRLHQATVEVQPAETSGSFLCELKGEFYDKSGQLKDPQRLYHRIEVITGEINRAALPPFNATLPQEDWMTVLYSDNWQERIEGHSGPVYYGPELRTLKSVHYIEGAHEVWGCFQAPQVDELGGARQGTRWQIPAAVLDGSLYLFEFLLGRLTGTKQLPHFIGQIDFGRMPVPGEQLLGQGRFLHRDDRHLCIEFDVWGADGAAIFACRDCKLVDLNVKVVKSSK
ncbi:MAG: polyketide synthase dehydratase domain-containing protein [Planctomycetaceae bacterium]